MQECEAVALVLMQSTFGAAASRCDGVPATIGRAEVAPETVLVTARLLGMLTRRDSVKGRVEIECRAGYRRTAARCWST